MKLLPKLRLRHPWHQMEALAHFRINGDHIHFLFNPNQFLEIKELGLNRQTIVTLVVTAVSLVCTVNEEDKLTMPGKRVFNRGFLAINKEYRRIRRFQL